MFNKESNIKDLYKVYNTYKWLIDSYVLDYFVENHWEKLPNSWKTLQNLGTNDISELLDYNGHNKSFMLPLSILALKSFFKKTCVPRLEDAMFHEDFLDKFAENKTIKMFWKNVKQKKRHEISIMAKYCHEASKKNKCFYLIDVGSGLGHLCRILSFGFNIKCCGIEAQQKLTEQAEVLDKQFLKISARNYGKPITCPVHINYRLELDIPKNCFLQLIKTAFNLEDDNFEFGIVGLHPCGDLGPTLLRLYKECENARYINIVGCCYMKLTGQGCTEFQGFPLSKFYKEINADLCYHSREIACHAIENYISRLNEGKSWKLKIHAYRAIIEKILIEMNPKLKHIPLANIKYIEDLTFPNYCEKALIKHNIHLTPEQTSSEEIEGYLNDWYKVVIFYSLRLLFAPMIESFILIDRLLYTQEGGCVVHLIPAFNPEISPRNHILAANK